MERKGRGAWPKDGRGGTLNIQGSEPGPYYRSATKDENQIGLKTWCQRAQSIPVQRDFNATFHGVVAIQIIVNKYGENLSGDGIFGPDTAEAVKRVQGKFGIISDGIVGRETMKWFLWPIVQSVAKTKNVDWGAIYGLLLNEGALDPGAIGWYDNNDIGLAQINLTYHPEISEAQALCPSFAINFIADYLSYSLSQLNGNLVDAVISYNLGIGGTRQWIAEGRPIAWTPSWSPLERYPFKYADRILNSWRN